MNILYMTTVLPGKQRTGGEIASHMFIQTLLDLGHQVTVVGYARQGDNYQPKPHEYVVGERFIETDKAGSQVARWFLRAFAQNLPYSAAKYHSSTYVQQLQKLQQQADLVVLEHSQLGWLLPYLTRPFVFNTQNIEHELYAQNARNTSGVKRWLFNREANLIKKMEDATAQKAQQVWTLTQHDATYFTNHPKVLTFGIPSAMAANLKVTQTSKACDIGLIGTWTWQANFAGLEWFLKQVHPLLPPHLTIHIAGKGAEKLSPFPNNVTYHGFVDDARQFMEQASVVAIPSVSGGGIQIKTLDAMAVGSPIVATPVALRGIEHYPDEVVVAEAPSEFAQALQTLLLHPVVTTKLADWSKQRQLVFRQDLESALAMW